jgi:hypothetical protein
MSGARVLFIASRPAIRYTQSGRRCVENITAVYVILPERRDVAVRAVRRFKRSRKPAFMALDAALDLVREHAEYVIARLAAAHMHSIADSAAPRLAAAVRVEEHSWPVVTGRDGAAILARVYMPYAVAAYEVPDVRDLLSRDRDYVTLYFMLRGPLYVFRGRVHGELLIDLVAQQLLDRLADTVLQLTPAVHTLQEVLIERGVARPADHAYRAVLPRETWQRIHDTAMRGGLKDEMGCAVMKALQQS